MNTQQVSIWVPIAVGLIGVLGIIAGQLINAWREDRRWKRELTREELRWQREDAHYWRERKFTTYGDLYSVLLACGNAIRQGIKLFDEGKELDTLTQRRLSEYIESYERNFHLITLFAGRGRTMDVMIESFERLHGFATQLRNGKYPTDPKSDDIDDRVGWTVDDFNDAIRNDLRILTQTEVGFVK
jgi:hypothetical protein